MSVLWTPGAYLSRRRRAAGLSLDHVAAQVRTEPHQLDEIGRRWWIASIEADLLPILGDVGAWRQLFPMDPLVLRVLIEVHRYGRDALLPRLCRICACSEFDACLHHGSRCAWAAEDLCTACAIGPAALPTPRLHEGART